MIRYYKLYMIRYYKSIMLPIKGKNNTIFINRSYKFMLIKLYCFFNVYNL